MKKHFKQAIAFDRDSPLNQRTGLGKKYNELVDEYNALEAKILGGEAQEIADVADDEQETVPTQSDEVQIDDIKSQESIVSDGTTTDDKPAKNKRG